MTAGILWNLASVPGWAREIALEGALGPLVGMLKSDLKEVRLGAAGALHMLATDTANKVAIAENRGIETLVQSLFQGNATGKCTMQIKAKMLGVLKSLAVDNDNRKTMTTMSRPTRIMPLVASHLSLSYSTSSSSTGAREMQRNAAGLLLNLILEDPEAQVSSEPGDTVHTP